MPSFGWRTEKRCVSARHDLRHHLNSLYQMMEEGRGEDAKRYIQDLEQPIRQSAMVTWTGHSLLDAILNVKRDEAGEKASI